MAGPAWGRAGFVQSAKCCVPGPVPEAGGAIKFVRS